MIESISDNPPAFPGGVVPGPDYHAPLNPGMSLRDWFAGQALAGILATGHAMPPDVLVGSCFGIADHMIKAREAKR